MTMTRWLAAGLIMLPLHAGACEGLTLTQPWIRAAPPGVTVMAGYGKLVNGSRKAITIDRIQAADFGSAELHQSRMVDGQMRMRRADPLTIAAGQTIELSPGGYHLMLMNPRATLAASSRIELHCADGDLAADFPVRESSAE